MEYKPYRYYFDTLTRAEKSAYLSAEKCFLSNGSEIQIPYIEPQRLSAVISMLRLDNPMIMNYKGYRTRHFEGSSSLIFMPEYTMSRAEHERAVNDVKKRLERIFRTMEGGLDDFEKEKFIHDFLIKSCVYDKLKKNYSHEIFGALCHGIGVCEGLSKTFKAMCDFAGIKCFTVFGLGVAPEEKTGAKTENHAWNVVYIGGEPYGMDVTFDLTSSDVLKNASNNASNNNSKNDSKNDSETGGINYEYFNIPDEIMMKNHGEMMYPYVKCRSTKHEYYSHYGYGFESADGIQKAIRQGAKKPYVTAFRIFGDFTYEEVKEKIKAEISSDKRYRKFASYKTYYNTDTGVIKISFTLKDFKKSEQI